MAGGGQGSLPGYSIIRHLPPDGGNRYDSSGNFREASAGIAPGTMVRGHLEEMGQDVCRLPSEPLVRMLSPEPTRTFSYVAAPNGSAVIV